MTKKQWIADGLLLAAAIIWGSAFAVVKNTLDSVPPSMMIALRFGIAALISGVILRKHLRGLTRGQVLMGLLVGVLTGLAYIVQTIGLQDTTVGKNAFLTTIYVLLVPFGSAVLFHEKLGARRYVAAVLMLLYIAVPDPSHPDGHPPANDAAGHRHPLAGRRKRRTESRRRADAGVRRAVCGADYLRWALQ